MENKLYTKDQIKDAIWKELKDSGHAGDNNGRAYEIIGVVMAGIEKITTANAQNGPRWVKASERLPKEAGKITWRWLDKAAAYSGFDGTAFVYDKGGARVDMLYAIEIEWLDESTPAGREEDAVAFAEWVRDNTVPDGAPKLFYKHDMSRYSIAQLYDIFKKEGK